AAARQPIPLRSIGCLAAGLCFVADFYRQRFTPPLMILKGVAISDRLKDALDFMLNDLSIAHRASRDNNFREATKTFITWN
ncbi:MAG: hypothetical protein ACJAQT_003248, partial [Akkermansiaceae bacterium]